MDTALHEILGRWGDYYLITGTAAAALTGLQFVVQTLIAGDTERMMSGNDPEAGIAAFGTPTVVHFALAMVVSSLLCVPWNGYGGLRLTLAVVGAGALVYEFIILRRARRQKVYETTTYDWIWYVTLPVVAYASVSLSGLLIGPGRDGPLFLVAAATMLLLLVGINNAWDTVTYLTVNAIRRRTPVEAPPTPTPVAGKPVGTP